MMTAEQWMEHAAFGSVSNSCIPLGYQPLLPVPTSDGSKLRFFYYGLRHGTDGFTIELPKYELCFYIANGRVFRFVTLAEGNVPSLQCDEMLTEDFEQRQKVYFTQLDEALKGCNTDSPDQLRQAWLEAQPVCLRSVLEHLIRTENLE